MAYNAQPINVAVLGSATTLYTAFVDAGNATRAMLVSLTFTNTTNADITLDVWYEKGSDASTKYLGKTLTVPALGELEWRGMATIDTSTDMWRAQASATGVDCVGTVMENG